VQRRAWFAWECATRGDALCDENAHAHEFIEPQTDQVAFRE
jgi:hypothetical protein